MFEAEARMATIEASPILVRLSEDLAQRFRVRSDAMTAEASLDGAELVMTADGDSLTLRMLGRDRGRFTDAMELVSRHLERAAGEGGGTGCDWRMLGEQR